MCLSQFLQGCRQPRDFLSQPSRKTSKIFCIIPEEFYICTTENGTSVFWRNGRVVDCGLVIKDEIDR